MAISCSSTSTFLSSFSTFSFSTTTTADVLVYHRLVVIVLRVVRRRHADAIGDLPALVRWPGRIGLVLLGLEAVDISGVQYGELPSHSPSSTTIPVAIAILRHRSGGGHRWCRDWRSCSDWCRILHHASLPCPKRFDKCE